MKEDPTNTTSWASLPLSYRYTVLQTHQLTKDARIMQIFQQRHLDMNK